MNAQILLDTFHVNLIMKAQRKNRSRFTLLNSMELQLPTALKYQIMATLIIKELHSLFRYR